MSSTTARCWAGRSSNSIASSLPEWVYRWENRYDAFEDAARKYVQQVVRRCDEAVDVWVCAGRLNVDGALGFSEEQRLRLAVRP